MPISDLNVVNQELLLFPKDPKLITVVNELTACNIGSTSLTLSLFKIFRECPEVRYYILNSIDLAVSETFVMNNLRIDINQEFYIGVSGGSCSVSTAYFR